MRLFLILMGMLSFGPSRPLQASVDVVPGPEGTGLAEWQRWFQNIQDRRRQELATLGLTGRYRDRSGAWAETAFRQYKIFMYDRSFYRDGSYRTSELIERLERRFGGVDTVILWHAYPQLGFDSRDQFDFYRQMPGGLSALRRDVVDVLHAAGIRVLLNYNPWDVRGDWGSDPEGEARAFEKMREIIETLNADGLLLDTMDVVPEDWSSRMKQARAGFVFVPERKTLDSSLPFARQGWAQWLDLGSSDHPSILRHKWLFPQHVPLLLRRWDRDRSGDIAYSFWNGSGMVIWENIFGVWNPYGAADRKALAETRQILRAYGSWIAEGEWKPLFPSGVAGVDLNRWDKDDRSLWLYRNRTDRAVRVPPPEGGGVFLRSDGLIPPHGTDAFVVDDRASDLRARVQHAGRLAWGDSADDEVTPLPRRVHPQPPAGLKRSQRRQKVDRVAFARIPGGHFEQVIGHRRRETGCYPWGATRDAQWGWYYEDSIEHRRVWQMPSFEIKKTAVTHQEYVDFVHASGYWPEDDTRFLEQVARNPDGRLPRRLPRDVADLPVTHVSLADARAYAVWKGEALPTEEEWQWVAEGAGQGRKWPWGNDDSRTGDPAFVNLSGRLAPADANPAGATAQGVLQMSGNAWEWTESEWDDGHTKYAMLRGGSYLSPAASVWIIPRGPRPNDFHAKYLLMGESLDRSEAITFRTVIRDRSNPLSCCLPPKGRVPAPD